VVVDPVGVAVVAEEAVAKQPSPQMLGKNGCPKSHVGFLTILAYVVCPYLRDCSSLHMLFAHGVASCIACFFVFIDFFSSKAF